MLLPAALALVAFVVGARARLPVVALLGLAGGYVSWRAFRRSARVEADAMTKALAAVLRPPAA